MTKTILAFGDSNTFGTPPMDKRAHPTIRRFPAGTRWPSVVTERTGFEVIEDGLPGRTATSLLDQTMGPHMNGPIGLRIALNSCGPIDGLILMLGTNDQKSQFGLSAGGIMAAVSALIEIARAEEVQIKHSGFDILLVCPPAVQERGVLKEIFYGAEAKSAELPAEYAALADAWGIDFFDAGSVISVSDLDGVHFEAEDQIKLGEALARYLKASS